LASAAEILKDGIDGLLLAGRLRLLLAMIMIR
jgi:hypothetical protein